MIGGINYSFNIFFIFFYGRGKGEGKKVVKPLKEARKFFIFLLKNYPEEIRRRVYYFAFYKNSGE